MVLLFGCSSTQGLIRLDTNENETILHIPRTAEVEPVKLTPEEFAQSLRLLALEVRLIDSPRETVWRMFQLDALSGDYLYLPRDRKLVPVGPGTALEGMLTEEEEKLTRQYKDWCERAYGVQGDCLGGALVGGRYLDLQGRYMLALALSKSPVLEEMKLALGEMVKFQAVMNAALWTVGTLMFLLALPEPVTKALAAAMTAALILWVGAHTLYNLITGWFQLTEEVKQATTFAEIRDAGERYGKVIGRDAARAFAMLAVAALTQTAQGFAERVAMLPGSVQISMQTRAPGGVALQVVGAVKEVMVTAEGFSVALPPGAMAMAARQGRTTPTEQASNYRETFFAAHPALRDKVFVHHAVEQQVLKRYPGLFTEAEIHSLKNLRGIPKSINPDFHLSKIRRAWNDFYHAHASPTKQEVIDFAAYLDRQFGALFQPPLQAARSPP
jgi:hypothetical protein